MDPEKLPSATNENAHLPPPIAGQVPGEPLASEKSGGDAPSVSFGAEVPSSASSGDTGPSAGAALPFLCACLLAGLFTHHLFFGKQFGISVPVFTVFYWAFFFATRRLSAAPIRTVGWFLFVPAALISFSFLLFTNPVLRALNVCLMLALTAVQTVVLARRNLFSWEHPLVLTDLLWLAFEAVVSFLAPARLSLSKLVISKAARRDLRKVAIGVALSIPVLFVIMGLLTSADQVFNERVRGFLAKIDSDFISALFYHLCFVLAVAAVFSGVFWVLRDRIQVIPQEMAPVSAPLDPVILSPMLALIIAVCALFCWIQFLYWFGSIDPDRSTGLTHAAYAQKGFYNLSVVTLLNMLLVLCGTVFVRKEKTTRILVLNLLLSLVVLLSGIILTSAFFRMALYENGYGFTRARVFAQTMMVLIAVLLTLMLVKVWAGSFPFFKACILSALLLYAGLNYIGVDAFIARKNVDRFLAGKAIDASYLARLSDEAAPQMLRFLECAARQTPQSQRVREDAALLEATLRGKAAEPSKPSPWPSYNIARTRARRLLEKRFPQPVTTSAEATGAAAPAGG